MKKRVLVCLSVWMAAALLLGGCGSAAGNSTASMVADMAAGETVETARGDSFSTSGGTAPQATVQESGGQNQEAKRIYTADVNLETQAFDEAVSGLTALVEQCGGWFQDSSVGDYGSGYRHGSYTVRVPAENFQTFLTQVGELCHVTWQSSSCEDVSEYYYDTAGRLKTQQTKLERLQALLAQAEDMEDIITIESAISDTEQQIDSLSGELRYYDSQVGYSTVRLDLEEVYRLSDTEEPASGFGARLGTALTSGWKGFISGIQGLLIALAYGWVWLVLLAAVACLVILWVRRVKKRKRDQRTADMRENAAPERKEDGK